MFDRGDTLGIAEERRDVMEPRVEDAGGGNRTQNCPLLSRERENRDLLSVRGDVAAERILATDVCGMLNAIDTGTRHEEGPNWDTPDCVPPGSAHIFRCLKRVGEDCSGRQLDLVEARH